MIWAARTRPVTASPVRYQLAARQQAAMVQLPFISRAGLIRSQLGMIGRG